MDLEKKFIIKVILLGDASVGKTSLLNKYIKNEFSLNYKATIGADFLTKQIQKENSLINLQIWDTAGSEAYHSIGTSFYRNCEICVLVFDLTNSESFKNIEFWRKTFINNNNPPEGDKFPFVIFGNKSDMANDIKVTEEQIKSYCSGHNNMPYFLVSAKDGDRIEEGFNSVCDIAFKRVQEKEDVVLPDIQPIRITELTEKKSKCPC